MKRWVAIVKRGGSSHLRLYIAVRDIQLVEGGKTFQKLTGDIPGDPGGAGTRVFEVVGQVAVLNVFHCDKDEVGVCVPAEKFDK